eukprot:COSAG01_NODE_14203_length_1483_cov_1.929191_1_plen_41_part_10
MSYSYSNTSRTTVKELRTNDDDKSMKQADLAVELYGPEALT